MFIYRCTFQRVRSLVDHIRFLVSVIWKNRKNSSSSSTTPMASARKHPTARRRSVISNMPLRKYQRFFFPRQIHRKGVSAFGVFCFSDLGALLHIVKGSLGAGILAMPFAFKNAGLVVATVGAIITGIIVTHTTAMLVNIFIIFRLIAPWKCD